MWWNDGSRSLAMLTPNWQARLPGRVYDLAEEIHAPGRPVTLSVGEHVRMPGMYRGFDIQRWMEAIGRLDERYDR